MALKQTHETDIQQAVGQAVSQYEQRLSTEQSHTQAHQSAIAELQGQMQALQVSLASQRDLPSVGVTQEGVNLRYEVFNYVPGTVNTNQGTVVYSLPDQAFSFQKHVRFGDRSNQPDLESDVAGSGAPTSSPITTLFVNTVPCRSSQVPLNQTFDVSGIPPANLGNAQDAATIAAEVLAAAVAQASKEFRQMWEPKITKLCGGYSADAELMCSSPGKRTFLLTFRTGSWITKLLSSLLKNRHWTTPIVRLNFSLTSAAEHITYQNLLRYLSIAFQGSGNDEANPPGRILQPWTEIEGV